MFETTLHVRRPSCGENNLLPVPRVEPWLLAVILAESYLGSMFFRYQKGPSYLGSSVFRSQPRDELSCLRIFVVFYQSLPKKTEIVKNLHGLSPRANYTDRE
jgi:hypothetical protein